MEHPWTMRLSGECPKKLQVREQQDSVDEWAKEELKRDVTSRESKSQVDDTRWFDHHCSDARYVQ